MGVIILIDNQPAVIEARRRRWSLVDAFCHAERCQHHGEEDRDDCHGHDEDHGDVRRALVLQFVHVLRRRLGDDHLNVALTQPRALAHGGLTQGTA